MDYSLFLDDIRILCDAFNYTKNTRYLKLEWIVVRSYDELVKYVIENSVSNVVSFDHDPDFLVHLWNNIGSENIKSYIRNFKKHNPLLT